MTVTNTLKRQPTELDYCDPTKFKFQIIKLPTVEYNTVQATLPGISLAELNQPTRLQQLKLAGNDLTFEDLSITFIVDEELINYRKVHDWMSGLAQVDGDTSFQNVLSDGQDRMPLSQSRGIQTEAGKIMPATPDGAIYSDAKLIVLSSRNLPKLEVTFVDCYPKSLSALEYNQQATDTEYLQATVTFGYKYHEYSTPF